MTKKRSNANSFINFIDGYLNAFNFMGVCDAYYNYVWQGEEHANEKEGGRGKGRGRGRGKGRARPQHNHNHNPNHRGNHVGGSSSVHPSNSEHPTVFKQPPGPRMPDGTRGFSMGRGKPVAV